MATGFTTSIRRRMAALALPVLAMGQWPAAHAGTDEYLGELMLFAGNFCPRGTLPADGTLLPIASYQAVFSLLGTTYGGNGTTNFALPDLRGRVPVGVGQGPGLSPVTYGDMGGTETVTLNQNNLPAHRHAIVATTAPATHATPDSTRVLAQTQNAGAYGPVGNLTNLSPNSTQVAGGGQPFSKRDPYLGMQWCITVQGIYPSRPD